MASAMNMEIEPDNGYQTTFSSKIVETLYLNEESADFHFICKTNDDERERIPAHKILLRGSDVFRAMFNEEWEDKTEVEIVDASAAVFKEFLQFFYLTKVNLTMENVGFVMNLGNKYSVRDCMEVCCKFLTDIVTDDNVCTVYGLAMFFEQEKLSKYCEAVIQINAKAVLSSSGFFECDRKELKYILDLDFISCSESDVFDAYMFWVKSKAGVDQLTREIVQAQLGHLWYEFRFSLTSPQDFMALLSSYGKLLTVDEIIEINQLIVVNGFKPTLFSGKARKSVDDVMHHGSNVFCSRILSYFNSSDPYHIKKLEVTTFSVSEPIILRGLGLVKLYQFENNMYYYSQDDLATKIEISQISNESPKKILCKESASINCDENTTVPLSKPILIRPNLIYEIRFKQSPPVNCVTGLLLKSEVLMESGNVIKFHRDMSIEEDLVARGLIRHLEFKQI